MKLKNTNIFVTTCLGLGALLMLAVMIPEFMPSDSSALTSNVTAHLAEKDYILSMSSDDMSINLETTPAGAFSYGKSTVTIQTNAPAGYDLYLSVNNDDTNGNRLFRSRSGVIDTTNYIEATAAASGTPDLNSWGYSVDYNATAGTGSWAPVPLKASSVAVGKDETANPTGATITTTKDIYYGVKADTAMADGDYTNTVLYTAIADVGESTVPTVLVNGVELGDGDTVDGGDILTINTPLVTATEIRSTDVTVTMGSSSCEVSSTDQTDGNLKVNCIAPIALEDDYDVVLNVTRFGRTYTIANVPYKPSFWGVKYMQDMTSEICGTVYTPSNVIGNNATIVTDKNTYKNTVTGNNQPYVPQRTLIDVRGKDGTGTIENPATGANEATYVIRKLADGNCWMVQNLDMSFGDATNVSTKIAQNDFSLDNTTTDIGYGTDSNGERTSRTSWTPDYKTNDSGNSSWGKSTDGARSYDNGEKWWDGSSGTTTTKPSDTTLASVRHFGNYYNWNSATAGSGFTGSTGNYTYKYSTEGAYAADSICPKGWKLPLNPYDTSTQSAPNSSFKHLIYDIYGLTVWSQISGISDNVTTHPMSFGYFGYYYGGASPTQSVGSGGYYWSSTVRASSGGSSAFLQITNNDKIEPGRGVGGGGDGLSIRCVAR